MTTQEAKAREAFAELWQAISRWRPELSERLPPLDVVPFPELSQLAGREVWWIASSDGKKSLTPAGLFGGLGLLGVEQCSAERRMWAALPRLRDDPKVIEMPLGRYESRPPDAVRDIYFSTEWFPFLVEPLEANYLAMDMDPGPAGSLGQIIVCGRDEETHAVVARNELELVRELGRQVDAGEWKHVPARGREAEHITHHGGRLLSWLASRLSLTVGSRR